ncbi:alpha/beta hydrolase [Paenibacillus sedimenti]|uniref:Alpha/beta hydrolase n=1 Tax=Paenibacillus sedimenti TaxID=2770274 RepID=A0A926KU42_9BACL|nr:alpha/beta hydrolase [Paenibacillus sedimenti]MBD0382184.1 alpha/beta hydrolase [Paenibacillus sedimenti]
MRHLFTKGTDLNAPVIVLFHGTGGTEHDLLPLAQAVAPTSSVLSVRGNVLENGMPRFFRRLAEGVFDEEDLIYRTQELNDFLDQAAADYGFDRNNLIAIGYSNGANIAGSLLFHHPGALRGAILHHPMVPRRGVKLPDLTGVPVFIGAGQNDPICSPRETEELQKLLGDAGASVAVHWERAGHQLTHTEVGAAAEWYKQNIA